MSEANPGVPSKSFGRLGSIPGANQNINRKESYITDMHSSVTEFEVFDQQELLLQGSQGEVGSFIASVETVNAAGYHTHANPIREHLQEEEVLAQPEPLSRPSAIKSADK